MRGRWQKRRGSKKKKKKKEEKKKEKKHATGVKFLKSQGHADKLGKERLVKASMNKR